MYSGPGGGLYTGPPDYKKAISQEQKPILNVRPKFSSRTRKLLVKPTPFTVGHRSIPYWETQRKRSRISKNIFNLLRIVLTRRKLAKC